MFVFNADHSVIFVTIIVIVMGIKWVGKWQPDLRI